MPCHHIAYNRRGRNSVHRNGQRIVRGHSHWCCIDYHVKPGRIRFTSRHLRMSRVFQKLDNLFEPGLVCIVEH